MHSINGTLATLAVAVIALMTFNQAQAIPAFARQNEVSCNTCHMAFPRLNSFGDQFASDMNIRMPNWKQNTVSYGDDQLALPKNIPLSIRAQAFAQARDGEAIDPVTGEVLADASTDFQAPYLIKLMSAAPLSENISYYFYGIFAEKGENGEVIIEDAWFSYADIMGSGIGLQLGQFQISDLMFPREQRLTFQDYMAYRFAGITYERGVIFGTSVGPVGIDFGFVNGNGIDENFSINSPGYRRPDHLFDNDTDKSAFARVGSEFAGVSAGLFVLDGEQENATGPAGQDFGDRDTDKRIYGLDLSGRVGTDIYWFAQYLDNRWDEFLNPGEEIKWNAGFIGVDYVLNDRWTLSGLYNHGDADDFEGSDTVYEGIDMETITFNASYYFMRNVKGVIEVNADLQSEDDQSGVYYTGHLDKENYILIGFDAAY